MLEAVLQAHGATSISIRGENFPVFEGFFEFLMTFIEFSDFLNVFSPFSVKFFDDFSKFSKKMFELPRRLINTKKIRIGERTSFFIQITEHFNY